MADLKITFPYDGELLNASFGARLVGTAYEVTIQGKATPRVTVSAKDATTTADENGCFTLSVTTDDIINEIPVTDGTNTVVSRFVCDFDNRKRYNFFIDDNVFFLTELVRKQHKSIFDSFYLNFLKTLHEKYGFKVTLNTFYHNAHDKDNFTTSELDTRYKAEFEDNADWLRLAFHSYSEYPDAPYGTAYPEKLPEHHRLVTSEIKRYAGEKSLIEPVLMHWFSINDDASRKYIAEQGMRLFGQPDSFWAHLEKVSGHKLLAKYDFQFKQLDCPILFMVNLFEKAKLLQMLEDAYAQPGRNAIVCGTHEQYSYPFYFNYIPDHFDRVDAVIRSLTEHGYECEYFNETILK